MTTEQERSGNGVVIQLAGVTVTRLFDNRTTNRSARSARTSATTARRHVTDSVRREGRWSRNRAASRATNQIQADRVSFPLISRFLIVVGGAKVFNDNGRIRVAIFNDRFTLGEGGA